MAAAKGNQFWKARAKHGRDKIFGSPEKLWAACLEYFQWVEENPLWEDGLVTFQGKATHEPVAKMRAMSIWGLCNFLDIGVSTWDDYRKRDDFSEVCTRAEEVMKQQKFEGASAQLLNPSIIARDLGLSDKKELSGPAGGPIEISDAKQRLAEKLAAK